MKHPSIGTYPSKGFPKNKNHEFIENGDRWSIVFDYPNYKMSEKGVFINLTTNHELSISLHKHGHYVVRLWRNNKSKLFKVYRMIAIHFIPNPEGKPQVNHKNGDRISFDLNDLEWVTASENMKHAFDNGLCKGYYKKGFEHILSKVRRDDVISIREMRKKGAKLRDISEKFNISTGRVSEICNYKTYKNV